MDDAEKLLLQLPRAVFGRLVDAEGGTAQQELSQLLAQLLPGLDAVMQQAAANRGALHPTLARPGRAADLAEIQSREQQRADAALKLIREHALTALEAVASKVSPSLITANSEACRSHKLPSQG